MRGDLIDKVLKGLDKVNAERMFPLPRVPSKTRGHGHRERGKPFTTKLRRNFLNQRMVNIWNSLPQRAVEAQPLSTLKTKFDRAARWHSG